MNASDITLVKTCAACPEQYDAFYKFRDKIAYLRLRYGAFTVECPDVGGELIYSVCPKGDGVFDAEERDGYLDDAKAAIAAYYSKSVLCGISVYVGPFVKPFEMKIPVPCDRDLEEYIDEFLDSILVEDLRYNCEWSFLGKQ